MIVDVAATKPKSGATDGGKSGGTDGSMEFRRQESLLKAGALQDAIFNRVIALTAMAMKQDRERSLEAGCDAYIAKPLRYQELYVAIDALLARGMPAAAGVEGGLRRTP